MAKEGLFLKYVDVPFSFSLVTLVMTRLLGIDLLDAVPYITFLGGMFASALELADPIGRIMKLYSEREFRNEVMRDYRLEKWFLVSDRISQSFKAASIQKPKDRITGIVYFIILNCLTLVSLKYSEEMLVQQYFIVLLSLILVIVVGSIVILLTEIRQFPRKAYNVSIQSAVILNYIQGGNWFGPLEQALGEGDWVLANHWVARGISDGHIQFTHKEEVPKETLIGHIRGNNS